MTAISRASTPSSASSAQVLAPALPLNQPLLSVKPIAAAPSPAPSPLYSVTSKEWIVPPRPKPGRKPATDTPPTKRKAQNRAAQRAFRERRAARVGELEEHIRKIEEENERDEEALNSQVESLSMQLKECRSDVLWWKRRCQTFEEDIAAERSAKETAIKELRAVTLHNEQNNNPQEIMTGCQDCSSTRCQCIDDAFNLSNISARTPDDRSNSKRQTSPPRKTAAKRHRSGFAIKLEPEELEIDFTSRFLTRRQSKPEKEAVSPTALFDPCGFCQDGTPCICAEMATNPPVENNMHQETIKLPPIQTLSQYTPPPSEGDVISDSVTNNNNNNNNKGNPCANGPGTCAQCLSDPKSTLFCKGLAASRGSSTAAAGCCGGNKAEGGCCQTRSNSDNAKSNSNLKERPTRSGSNSSPPITLSCADAFTTLSRHPQFSRASDELSTWLPRLHTLPNPRDLVQTHPPRSLNINSRPALEVEAASVMGVLRYFDRRFADN